MRPSSYRTLNAAKIVETVQALQNRIQERFPDSGLGRLVGELLQVSREAAARAEWMQRPHRPLRLVEGLLIVSIVTILARMISNYHEYRISEFSNFIQVLEAGISAVVFIGAAIVFLVSWETRIKRRRAISALHELRAMAHIVDMHQLTKDPERMARGGPDTASSPRQTLTPFELNRYLDYCTEALALISKIAALYAQGIEDGVVLDAVDNLEDLVSGLSRKIWQKIALVDSILRDQSPAVAGLSTRVGPPPTV